MNEYKYKGRTIVKVGDMVSLAPLYMVRDIRRCPDLADGDIEVLIGDPESNHGGLWVMLDECDDVLRMKAKEAPDEAE